MAAAMAAMAIRRRRQPMAAVTLIRWARRRGLVRTRRPAAITKGLKALTGRG
jgi:hypothetical protein